MVWSPYIGEFLNTPVEPDNFHDNYAVTVLKSEAVGGHAPREILRYCSFVLNLFKFERNCDWRPRKQERKWTDSIV